MAMVATRRLCGYPPSSTQSDLDGGKGDHNVQSSGGDYDVDIDGGEEEHKGTVVPGLPPTATWMVAKKEGQSP